MNGALLPICAFIFETLLVCIYFSKKRIKLVENDVYGVMLIVSLIDAALVSVLQLVTIGGVTGFENVIVQVFNRIDFICLLFLTNCIFLYTCIITINKEDSNKEEKTKQLIKMSAISNFIGTILIIFGSVNIITQNGNYSIEGTSATITIGFAVIYILLALILAIKNIKKADRRYIPIFSIIGIIIFLVLVFSVNPYVIIISITFTFINYLMYFTIENPDMKLINQLEIAKNQAEKANSAKTDFLSSMSHEIRTPLNAIVGFSNCIIESNSIDEAKENAKDVITASSTLLEIVNGILDISKIEAGKIEIVNSPYDAKSLFEELAKLITPKMTDKNLDFTYHIANDLPETLYGDHTNIKKIVTNLLSNACKYTKQGYVNYEVNCYNVDGICRLIISVEDSGRGIKKENIDKLFNKFERIDIDRNTTIEGTGLGLAITKKLIELMGGKIIVQSVYGSGSKFTVILNQRIETTPIKKEEVRDNQVPCLENARILIVDDNELNIKVATKLLQKYNATNITSFTSGFSCIEDIEKGTKYDLILLDDMMPKMSGVETLKKLRQFPGYNIPTVVLTANAITGMKEKYINDGFDDYLAKPIDKLELVKILNKYITCNKKITKDSKEEEIEELTLEEETKKTKSPEEYLKENGVDLQKSLELLGDMEMYNETIKDFMNDVENKWQKIKTYLQNNDMPNYAIEVHSLKSDCKYLGFNRLAELSYEHELKSKDNDSDYVKRHFEELEVEYKKTINIAKTYINENTL